MSTSSCRSHTALSLHRSSVYRIEIGHTNKFVKTLTWEIPGWKKMMPTTACKAAFQVSRIISPRISSQRRGKARVFGSLMISTVQGRAWRQETMTGAEYPAHKMRGGEVCDIRCNRSITTSPAPKASKYKRISKLANDAQIENILGSATLMNLILMMR